MPNKINLYKRIEKLNIIKRLETLTKKPILPKIIERLNFINWTNQKYVIFRFSLLAISIVISVFFINFIKLNHFSLLGLLIYMIFAFISLFYADSLILDISDYKKFKIKSYIPEFLNIVAIYLESGSYASFKEVIVEAEKISEGEFKFELSRIVKNIDLLALNDILTKLDLTFNDEYITELTNHIKLQNEYGEKLSEKVFTLATTCFNDRMSGYKEAAIQGSGKLLIPLMFFHMPVILAIFLLPILLAFNSFI